MLAGREARAAANLLASRPAVREALADDLAVNAENASGFLSDRQIPVLWKLTKGSLLNKVIILPVAFLLSAFLPVAIVPILVIGGIYLAFEGAEKFTSFYFTGRSRRLRSTWRW